MASIGNDRTCLEGQIRSAMRKSGLSISRIIQESGVADSCVHGFASGRRGIELATASKLAEALDLELMGKDVKKNEPCLEDQFRTVIKRRGLKNKRLAIDAGVPQPSVSRFVNGHRGLRLTTASKLANVLGLALRPRRTKRRH